jgi:hypothetical protein
MSLIETMLRTHPHPPAHSETLQTAIVAAYECAQICTSCADACLSEPAPEELRSCIRLDLDCAEICLVTGTLLSRIGTATADLKQAQLRLCLMACRLCEEECMHHAKRHEHCRICAQACRSCREACERLLEAPPRAH